MRQRLFTVFLVCLCLAVSARAYGQGGISSSITGIVVDPSGAVVPGANVQAKHTQTGVASETVSNTEGLFTIPGLNVGAYVVTVSLSGFKTFIANNVVLTSGAGATVRAVLEVGGVSEQVTVTSSSEIVQTQSPTVSTTVSTNQITKLPLTSRSAMDFVNMLPGVSTPAGNRDATINGLPRGSINITLDGVNIQDNTLRSTDGFFAIVSPRLDAIEEVTLTTASQGAADAGQGAVQVKFVTRAGTNTLTGSGYYYARRDRWNANTWFNNRSGTAKAKLVQNQEGFRAGGPIYIPHLFDGHNKAFFFVNYEQVDQPNDVTRDRTVLNAAARAGNFAWAGGTVNVLDLAARNGHLATPDPTIAKILQEIQSATQGGSLQAIDANLERFRFNVPTTSTRYYPTFRLDYNLNAKHRASFAYNYQKFSDYPDTLNNHDNSFPGFPAQAGQTSIRLGWSGSVRSTLTSNMVNEARVGYSGAPVRFFDEYAVGMFAGSAVNQGGFRLTFPAVNTTLTSPSPAPAPQSRNANSVLLEDTVTWLKGAHSLSLGGSFTQYDIWMKNSSLVPRVNFVALASDPASAMFNATNFPGASAANLTAAQQLYNLLVGRISTITADARLDASTGEYKYLGTSLQEGRLREGGVYVQDQWRLKPNLTLNVGVRYDVQLPFYALNSLYTYATMDDICGVSGKKGDNSCNLFQPGNMPGVKPTFKQLTKGTKLYETDWNNVAPNVGFAWTPSARQGFLGGLMGREGDFVVRGGYTRSFTRGGLSDFTTPLSNNPGITITANRDPALGNFGPLPVLLRETSRLGPPDFATKPAYPLTDVVTEDVRGFDPHLRVPYADSYSIGVQRGLGTKMVVEVRYVGTRARDQWRTYSGGAGLLGNNAGEIGSVNFNEFNIFENKFIDEFRQAQANLQANITNGRGNTFAYTGAPGTAPLPVFLGFFNAQSAANAGNPTAYTGTNWTSTTFLNFLAARNPNPFGFASAGSNGLMGNATLRANAATAGIPANYFVANPDLLGGALMTTNIGKSKYNSMQFELRRRYADGLQFSGSYVFGHGYISNWETFRKDQFYVRDAGTPGDITHQGKFNIVYDLPFGQGRHWGSSANGVLERIIGGWQIGLNSKIQSGRLVDLGNVRLVGMTTKDVEGMFKLRFDNAGQKVWMLPQDVIDNTVLAFSVSPTTASGYAGAAPTGRYFAPANGPDCIEVDNGADYGACASRSLIVTGPLFRQHDLRVSKQTKLIGRTNLEVAAEILNVLNQANFVPVGGLGSTLANYEVTALQGTNTSRVLQLVARFNW